MPTKAVPQDTAAKAALNPMVQVVALVEHKAFRRADMHNSYLRGSLRLEAYRLKNILGWRMPQGTEPPVYMRPR